jgi:pyruvate dehydrogenase E2 component (dihydrolipoamide acetyltransferase)
VRGELTMPKLSDSMEEATILRWLKEPGEAFSRGEGLAEIETDKATVVYEAEFDGMLATILVPEGSSAAVGAAIARLHGDGAREAPRSAAADAPLRERPDPGAYADEARGPAAEKPKPSGERARATPVARRRALEFGVSLHGIVGTGPGGRITAADVAGAAATQAPRPEAAPRRLDKGSVETVRLTPTQATIARRMTLSATTVPTFTVTVDVDMATIAALRRDVEAAPSVNDFVVKASALTLREFPSFNASYVDDGIERYSRVNVGIAVATDEALLVSTLFDADRKSLREIAMESRELVRRARERKLTLEELMQSTFTVSNLGMFGVRSFTAIVDVPQTAILAVGAVERRPYEEPCGGVAFRETMTMTMTCDHRVVYGADGARFVAHLRGLLERPLTLAL